MSSVLSMVALRALYAYTNTRRTDTHPSRATNRTNTHRTIHRTDTPASRTTNRTNTHRTIHRTDTPAGRTNTHCIDTIHLNNTRRTDTHRTDANHTDANRTDTNHTDTHCTNIHCSNEIGHSDTRSANSNSKPEYHQPEPFDQPAKNRTAVPALTDTPFFSTQSHVDARNSFFSNIGRDQIITFNIDPDPERQKIAEWLSPLNFKPIHSEIFQNRVDGTGQWLLNSKEFKDWRDGRPEVLWCPGIPGAGKTILASIIINHLQTVAKNHNVAITYIYCNYKQQTEQSALNLVASLLKQLAQDDCVAYDNVKCLYNHHKDLGTRPTLDEFLGVLQLEAERYSKFFIVVDALDECSEVDGTRRRLLAALQTLTSTANLLVTSRDLASIETDFHGTKRLDIYARDDDVRRYVERRIPHESRLAIHVDGHPTLREEIVKRILENVQGMFLLARLHVDLLATTTNRSKVHEVLGHLPQGINGIYNETMKRVDEQIEGDRKLAEQVFCWIIHAYRQLSLEELRHALAVSSGMTKMDPDALVEETILTSVCAGLVVVDKETRVVRLVHYTAQEYFERIRKTRFPLAQVNITATCITYLSFDVFRGGYFSNDLELQTSLQSNPLLDYAARYWGHHARCIAEESQNTQDLVLKFLEDSPNFPCVSQAMHMQPYNSQAFSNALSQMHISAFFGLERTTRCLLRQGANADSNDTRGRTPLSWAADKGQARVVKLLVLRDDVNVNSKDTHGRTPLSRAGENGHERVVRLLLEREDVDINLSDSYGRTPLSWAAEKGHEAVTRMLLARNDINVNPRDIFGRTPLSWAAEQVHQALVSLLLARSDIDVNLGDNYHRTPLSWAADKGHEVVLRLLLAQNDTDVNPRDIYGRTPLFLAAERGHEKVVELLLAEDDIDVNLDDYGGRTPLSWAAERGHETVVILLLARDNIDVNLSDDDGRTPLSWAAGRGRVGRGNAGRGCGTAVKLPLARDDRDIDINSSDDDTQTQQSWAVGKGYAGRGHEAVVKLLLAQDGIDVNSSDNCGQTPLSWAAEKGYETVVQLLLARDDINVDSSDECGQTPLSWAAERGHEAVVKLLLARDDIEVNSRDKDRQAPLSWAAIRGHETVMGLLLARDDIDVNLRDDDNRTPLSWAAGKGYDAVVKLLLARHDIDVNLSDDDGRIPLSWAARAGHEKVVKLLLEHGNIDINARGKDGRTPLVWATEGGHKAVAKLLVEQDAVEYQSNQTHALIARSRKRQ